MAKRFFVRAEVNLLLEVPELDSFALVEPLHLNLANPRVSPSRYLLPVVGYALKKAISGCSQLYLLGATLCQL